MITLRPLAAVLATAATLSCVAIPDQGPGPSLSEIDGLPIARAKQKQPNIVLIVSDDQAFTDYGFMGHDAIKTPNLDRLAKQGALFRRGYVPTALCRPSLMTMATGLHAHQHRITGNDPARNDVNKAHAQTAGKTAKELLIANVDRLATLPRLLADAGYVSHQSGKWWEGSYRRGGFTNGMTRGYPKKGGRHGDDGLRIGRRGMAPVFDFMNGAAKSGKPFFVWYAPFLPHTPHNPPQRLLDKYRKAGRPEPIAKYYAMVEWFDETCGQLLAHLDEKSLSRDTLVIYVADNGWLQRPDARGYAARSKRSPYEGGTRTPIMVRWPARVPPADRPELCTSLDIFPTVLAAAGIPCPKGRSGLNLLPYLTTGKPIERDAIFGASFAHDIADIENPDASVLFRWTIKGSMKLLLTDNGKPGRMRYPPKAKGPQLFDLSADPMEKHNLAPGKPELVQQLRGLINAWYEPKAAQRGGR